LSVGGSVATDTAFYKVIVSNGSGSAESTHEYLLVQGQPMFNGNGLGWKFNSENPAVNGGGSIVNNVFAPTDGTAGENRSAWYAFKQYIGAFQASLTYQDVGGNGADGAALVIQNDPRGLTALGGGGGGLGYSSIS